VVCARQSPEGRRGTRARLTSPPPSVPLPLEIPPATVLLPPFQPAVPRLGRPTARASPSSRTSCPLALRHATATPHVTRRCRATACAVRTTGTNKLPAGNTTYSRCNLSVLIFGDETGWGRGWSSLSRTTGAALCTPPLFRSRRARSVPNYFIAIAPAEASTAFMPA